MDVLTKLLEPVDVRGAVFCHGEVRAPWRFEGGARGSCLFHCIVDGTAWLTRVAAEPIRLCTGDVVLLTRGGRHRMGSRKSGPALLLADAVADDPTGAPFARFQIGGDGHPCHLICGHFSVSGMQWHPLLRALPDAIVVNAATGRWLSPTLHALERYVEGDEPGAELITRNLSNILFVQAIASWLSAADVSNGWLQALRDPHLARALGEIHGRPDHSWSVDELAQAAGLSRTVFHRRFKELVGSSPAKYVVHWRMTLAGQILVREQAAVADVATRVGYASVPSFTQAFRRVFQESPAAYRRRARPRMG